MALFRCSSGSGGGTSDYVEYGRSLTTDVSIDLGFEPKDVFIVSHLPNYQRPLYVTYWTKTYSTYQYQASWGSNFNANRYNVPYTSSGMVIKDIVGSVVTFGYNSSLGANQTIDIFAYPDT